MNPAATPNATHMPRRCTLMCSACDSPSMRSGRLPTTRMVTICPAIARQRSLISHEKLMPCAFMSLRRRQPELLQVAEHGAQLRVAQHFERVRGHVTTDVEIFAVAGLLDGDRAGAG